MKLSCIVSLALLVCAPMVSQAQVKTEASILDILKNKLNVDISNSCAVMESSHTISSGNPFDATDKCNEGDLKDLKQITGSVYRVVDGDTIHFYAKNKLLSIRMLGMDTPELHFLGRAQPKWGALARDSLKAMVDPGDLITLELDKVKCDRYGRILGHVFKGKTNLNFEQIRKGFAANYCISPNMKHCNAYGLAYAKAAEERIRIHADPCFVTPYVWRRAMNGTLMDKKLKDSRDGTVYSAKDYYLVPVAYRIFYSNVYK